MKITKKEDEISVQEQQRLTVTTAASQGMPQQGTRNESGPGPLRGALVWDVSVLSGILTGTPNSPPNNE